MAPSKRPCSLRFFLTAYVPLHRFLISNTSLWGSEVDYKGAWWNRNFCNSGCFPKLRVTVKRTTLTPWEKNVLARFAMSYTQRHKTQWAWTPRHNSAWSYAEAFSHIWILGVLKLHALQLRHNFAMIAWQSFRFCKRQENTFCEAGCCAVVWKLDRMLSFLRSAQLTYHFSIPWKKDESCTWNRLATNTRWSSVWRRIKHTSSWTFKTCADVIDRRRVKLSSKACIRLRLKAHGACFLPCW